MPGWSVPNVLECQEQSGTIQKSWDSSTGFKKWEFNNRQEEGKQKRKEVKGCEGRLSRQWGEARVMPYPPHWADANSKPCRTENGKPLPQFGKCGLGSTSEESSSRIKPIWICTPPRVPWAHSGLKTQRKCHFLPSLWQATEDSRSLCRVQCGRCIFWNSVP